MSITITGTLELLGALGSNDESAVKEVASKLDLDVETVYNSTTEVHLALPFYSGVANPVSAISDDDLEAVSGGSGSITETNNAVVRATMGIVNHAAKVAEGVASVASGRAHSNSSASPMEMPEESYGVHYKNPAK